MRITTKGRYALRAILNLAGATKPVPIKEIAEKESISPEFLEQIFFKLKKAGVISSTRGPKGGFTLAHKPDDVSVVEIFDAVEESLLISPCVVADDHTKGCPRSENCPTHPIWLETADILRNHFAGMTINDVLSKSAKKV
jgi:Rrf2 family iron-sulfur cluster assembly transcriptional regulator